MVIDENWALSIERAHAFFKEQNDVFPNSNGYQFGSCQITLTEIPPKSNHPFAVPRTRLEIVGPMDEAKSIHRRFFLRFLSAGG